MFFLEMSREDWEKLISCSKLKEAAADDDDSDNNDYVRTFLFALPRPF